MSMSMGAPRIGRWYLRWDKGEIFQVTGYDTRSRAIQIRTCDGDSQEISADAWPGLQLGMADPPVDWSGPLEIVDEIDLAAPAPAQETCDPTRLAQPTEGEQAVSEDMSEPKRPSTD